MASVHNRQSRIPREVKDNPRLRHGSWCIPALVLLAGLLAVGARHSPVRPTHSALTGRSDDIYGSCLTSNPYFATTLFRQTDAIVAFRDAPRDDYANPEYLRLAELVQVGSVHGLAVDPARSQLYASAMHERGARLGIGGPGGIYRVDLETGETSLFASLDAGTTEDGWAAIGKTSLGDIDLDPESQSLFVANLHDRQIYRLSVPDGAVLGSFAHGASSEPWSANARLFGLGVRDGWIYHGVVDSRQQADLPGTLDGYIYQSRSDGADMSEVARFGLGYDRSSRWHSWADPGSPGQPVIADIEFRPNGDLIVGLRDRSTLMGGGPEPGDILSTERVGDTWRVVTSPKHYHFSRSRHYAVGPLAAFPGRDWVVARTGHEHEGGATWFDNATGGHAGANGGWEPLDGEANSGGDVEPLCLADQIKGTAYLPIADMPKQRKCLRVPAGVVMVLDMSTSMDDPTVSGQSKSAVAIEASGNFLQLLDFTRNERDLSDQAAVVGFNDTAWIEQGPTREESLLQEALDRLPAKMTEGTRLDLALNEAWTSFSTGEWRTVMPAIIVLTDGRPNRVPAAEDGSVETTILRAAGSLKRRGLAIYTIGLGTPDDINPALLQGMASDSSKYYHAPDAEYLAAIYAEIARDIGYVCP